MRRSLAAIGNDAVQVALIAVASAMILFPQARAELPHSLLYGLLAGHSALATYRNWRAGRLQLSVGQLLATMQSKRAHMSNLEGWAFGLGFFALLILALA